jgi:hypothetical protein
VCEEGAAARSCSLIGRCCALDGSDAELYAGTIEQAVEIGYSAAIRATGDNSLSSNTRSQYRY